MECFPRNTGPRSPRCVVTCALSHRGPGGGKGGLRTSLLCSLWSPCGPGTPRELSWPERSHSHVLKLPSLNPTPAPSGRRGPELLAPCHSPQGAQPPQRRGQHSARASWMPAPCQAPHPGRGHRDWARFTVRTQRLGEVTSPTRGHAVGAGSGCERESTAPGAVRVTCPCPGGPGAGALRGPLCQGVQPAQQPYRSLLQGQPVPWGPLPTGGSRDRDSYVFRPRAGFPQLGSRGPSAGLAPPCLQVPPQAQGEEKRLAGFQVVEPRAIR